MKANCVVCGKFFKKLRGAKTCGKECTKEKNRRYKYEHRDHYAALRRYRYATDPAFVERVRARSKRYQIANKESRREYVRNYNLANRAMLRAAMQKWQKTNREYINAYNRKYRTANTEQCRAYSRKHQRFVRSAQKLGIPPLVYAAMKIKDRLTQSKEQLNDQDRDQSL